MPPSSVPYDAVQQYEDQISPAWANLTGVPTTRDGFGITDVYTKTETDAELAAKAPLASPVLTGVPEAPTAASGDNTTQIATTAFVQDAVASAGGAALGRNSVSITTTSLAPGATDNSHTAPIGKSGVIIRVETDRPARVRLYATAAALTADTARPAGTDPTGEHGVLLDLVTTATTLDFVLSPKVVYSSDETTPSSNISMAVQNLDTSASTVTVVITRITIET